MPYATLTATLTTTITQVATLIVTHTGRTLSHTGQEQRQNTSIHENLARCEKIQGS